LTRHPEWQDRIREELGKLDLDSNTPRFLTGTEAPIMEAVINEGLRLHPAAPASLPRSTPRGGATLANYYIPEDVSQRSVTCTTFDILLTLNRLLSQHNATQHNEIPPPFQIQTRSNPSDG
jgi:hypothetical protein